MKFDSNKNCSINNIDVLIFGSLCRFIFFKHFSLEINDIKQYFINNPKINNVKNLQKQINLVNKYKDKLFLNFNFNKKINNNNFINHYNYQIKKFNKILFVDDKKTNISEIGYSYNYIQTKNLIINMDYNFISEIIFDPFINNFFKNNNKQFIIIPFDINDDFDTYNAYQYFWKFNSFSNTNFNYSFSLFKNLIEDKHNSEDISNYNISNLIGESFINFKYICLVGINFLNDDTNNNNHHQNNISFNGNEYMFKKLEKFKKKYLNTDENKKDFSKSIIFKKIDIDLKNVNKIINYKEIEYIYLWILKNMNLDDQILDINNKLYFKENLNFKLNEKLDDKKNCKIF